ncbi:MAG: hypothetical protein AAFR61_02940 [Bacteroidota bacterium]
MKPVNQTERRNAFLRFLVIFLLGMGLTGFGVTRYHDIDGLEISRLKFENDSLIRTQANVDTVMRTDSMKIQEWVGLVEKVGEKLENLSNKYKEWEQVFKVEPAQAAVMEVDFYTIEGDINTDRISLARLIPASQEIYFKLNAEILQAFQTIQSGLKADLLEKKKLAELAVKDIQQDENEQLREQLVEAQNEKNLEEDLGQTRGKLKNALGQMEDKGGLISTGAQDVIKFINSDLKGIALRKEKEELKEMVRAIKEAGDNLKTMSIALQPN